MPEFAVLRVNGGFRNGWRSERPQACKFLDFCTLPDRIHAA
jgi:hypothetical protein